MARIAAAARRTHNGKLGQVRDWEPKRDGPEYCAPACGRGCTWEEYQRACKQAESVKARLTISHGPGWKARIHENLGWHWSVYRGPLNVYGHTHNLRTTYSCLLADVPAESNLGAVVWSNAKNDYQTPAAAVTAQLALAAGVIEQLQAALKMAGARR